MSARQTFELAVNAGAPSGYFNTALFLVPLEQSEHPAAQRVLTERIASAQIAGATVVAQLMRAAELAGALGFDASDLPSVPTAYFPWFGRLDAAFAAREGYPSGRLYGEASGSLYYLNEILIVAYQLKIIEQATPLLSPLLESLERIAGQLPESEAREGLFDLGDYDWLEDDERPLSERLAPVRSAYDLVRRQIERMLPP